MGLLFDYSLTILAVGALGALLLVQLLVADVIGILRKHEPGTPVEPGHDDPLFRASRVVGNVNESIAIFVVAVLFATWRGASPDQLAYAVWSYVILRALYAGCYYFDVRILRSVMFALSVVALLAILILGAIA